MPFTGPDANLRAEQELSRLKGIRGLSDAFVIDYGPRTVVCIGKVISPNSGEATRLLQRVRTIKDGGTTPFSQVFFIPPTGIAQSDLDLRSVPNIYGQSAIYSLQVGVYGRADKKAPTERDVRQAREKAEQAVMELREQGELAFYYHGPSMSMVTIGVFSDQDIQDSFSFELRSLMERFPNNLFNGKGVNQTVRTTDGRQEKILQASFPVLIPQEPKQLDRR